jgi:hypothetical protein
VGDSLALFRPRDRPYRLSDLRGHLLLREIALDAGRHEDAG